MAKGHRTQIKRKRNAEKKDLRPRALAKFVRVSPSKAKIVLDEIKGKNAEVAVSILKYSPRYAARVIEKVLKSAMANAENNLGLDISNLFVQEAFANDGPIMKRIHPRSQGRAYRIEKKMSHISIVLVEKNNKIDE